MRVIDVDAHVHEPVDWLEQTDSELADKLGPPLRFIDVADGLFGISNPGIARLPDEQQPADRWDTVLPGFKKHLEMTDERQSDHHVPGDPFCDAPSRLAKCDAEGIDVQFLNPSFLASSFARAARVDRPELAPRIKHCWNEWIMQIVHGHTERLMPVTQINLGDVSGSIKEMTRMRALGSRAFSIGEAPVGVRSGRAGDHALARSITHSDFEPLWSAAEDLGMAAISHVGFGRERIQFGWANNGASDLTTYSLLSMAIAPSLSPQLLLGALVFDGVLERHPKLNVIVEELGISWLPHLVSILDRAVGRQQPEQLLDDEFRPTYAGSAYQLPLAPSEYLSRQVKVTPLVATEPLRPTLDLVPPGMICFSSDYPHVEGSGGAVEICERQLVDLDVVAREGFYGGIGDRIGL
ncbi:MAG: putative TIM-barrel fold metal-dependent hydrolase [Candidatus Azotimanducaceae bacterium]|jgi:predicted TIM-barrel fold metal-dependent hydrolase